MEPAQGSKKSPTSDGGGIPPTHSKFPLQKPPRGVYELTRLKRGVSRAVTHGAVSPETGDGLKDTEDPGASCGLRAAPFMALSLSFLICKMCK